MKRLILALIAAIACLCATSQPNLRLAVNNDGFPFSVGYRAQLMTYDLGWKFNGSSNNEGRRILSANTGIFFKQDKYNKYFSVAFEMGPAIVWKRDYSNPRQGVKDDRSYAVNYEGQIAWDSGAGQLSLFATYCQQPFVGVGFKVFAR